MTNINLNEYIDHTMLKADATLNMIKKLCEEAKKFYFKAVCVNPYYVKYAAELLANSNVKVCTVVGFPLGSSITNTKVQEAMDAIEAGADEIDMVINIGALKDNNQSLVLQDIKAVRAVCPKNIILKVIIECSLLTEEEKIIACRLASEAQADFVKTATGFAKAGANVEDIKLIKANIASNVAIKASGGIKSRDDALAIIAAGATRMGTSNGIAIINNSKVNKEDY